MSRYTFQVLISGIRADITVKAFSVEDALAALAAMDVTLLSDFCLVEEVGPSHGSLAYRNAKAAGWKRLPA